MTQLLGALEFEEAGRLTLTRFERVGAGAAVVLDVRSLEDAFEPQAWRVAVADLRACRLDPEAVGAVALLADHVLLAPFHDPHVRLGLKGRARDPYRAVADPWACHRNVAGDWIPFGACLNGGLPLPELLTSGAAVLAEGPRRVLAAYSEVLAAHGVEAYVIDERLPVRWTGHAWEPERRDVELLLLGPGAWLIGAGFSAEPLGAGAAARGA